MNRRSFLGRFSGLVATLAGVVGIKRAGGGMVAQKEPPMELVAEWGTLGDTVKCYASPELAKRIRQNWSCAAMARLDIK